MKITLLRHAPTLGNLRKCYIGHTDEPLSPQGIKLASLYQCSLPVKQVHTSTLQRTIQTASILYPHAEIIPHSGFCEMNFGDFEGKNWHELQHNKLYTQWVAFNCETSCPRGENKQRFIQRCVATFREVIAAELVKQTPHVYMVLHSGTIMAILSELSLPEKDYFDWKTDFCKGYSVELQGNIAADNPLLLLHSV